MNVAMTVQHIEHVKPDLDPSDPSYKAELGKYLVREQAIATMGTRILRDRLKYCYRVEGVNHKKYCAELIDEYRHRFQLYSGNFKDWEKQVENFFFLI